MGPEAFAASRSSEDTLPVPCLGVTSGPRCWGNHRPLFASHTHLPVTLMWLSVLRG
jgi:hypothetical protein